MLELGENSAQLHFETGALAKETGAALVLTVGKESAETARGAGDCGRHFESKADLLAVLPALIAEGDTVLVKASRSMAFEEITEALEKL